MPAALMRDVGQREGQCLPLGVAASLRGTCVRERPGPLVSYAPRFCWHLVGKCRDLFRGARGGSLVVYARRPIPNYASNIDRDCLGRVVECAILVGGSRSGACSGEDDWLAVKGPIAGPLPCYRLDRTGGLVASVRSGTGR
jgi:hypothetical protein